jgi:hypothetical protein
MPVMQFAARNVDQSHGRQAIIMYDSKTIRPVNSVILIADPRDGDVPKWKRGR